jgi:PAS domain S-box-containing protein
MSSKNKIENLLDADTQILHADRTRIEQAETRADQAKTRADQAVTETDQAKTRTKQAETQTRQAGMRKEQAATQTEQAETRREQAETKIEQTKTSTMEQALRASELSYRRLFEAAKDGILILDVNTGRINDVNPYLFNLLGFSRDEMMGKTVGELSPFKDIEENKVMLARLQRDGYIHYEDLPLETRDGRKIAVEFVSNVYQAGDRKVIQCNIRNITERKRASEALRASEERYRTLYNCIDEGFCVVEMLFGQNGKPDDYRFLEMNPAFEKHTGIRGALGKRIREFVPDHEALWFEAFGKVALTGEPVRFENEAKAMDRWFDVYAFRLGDSGSLNVAILFTDTTKRKVAEEKIRQLNVDLEQRVAERTAQLKSANEELEAFSYSVSHDLRAPLRHIMGFVELLHKDAASSLSEKNLKYLATISDSARRMGNLIDDLLDFSRVGRAEMQKANINLDELVRDTLGDFQTEAKERKIVVKIHPLPMVQADRSLLRLVLVNLISNAVKFTSHRAEAIIEIGCVETDEGRERRDESQTAPPSTLDARPSTTIYVRDNGAGFDPLYVHKLFGVFQRLHSNAEFEGTGIGLANVQRIIQRHGGRVWAEGKVDGGATFYFSIPKQNGATNGH